MLTDKEKAYLAIDKMYNTFGLYKISEKNLSILTDSLMDICTAVINSADDYGIEYPDFFITIHLLGNKYENVSFSVNTGLTHLSLYRIGQIEKGMGAVNVQEIYTYIKNETSNNNDNIAIGLRCVLLRDEISEDIRKYFSYKV